MGKKFEWVILLLDTLQSSEGAQQLSHWYWELLVELAISVPQWLQYEPQVTYTPQIAIPLTEVQEWDRLECWIGTVWMI